MQTEKVRNYIETGLAPRLQGDGGWVECGELKDGVMPCVFRGECSKCLILDRCVAWMEEKIEKEFQERVQIQAIRKKPYFWDAK